MLIIEGEDEYEDQNKSKFKNLHQKQTMDKISSDKNDSEDQIEEEIDHDPVVAQQKAWDRLVAKNNKADEVVSVVMA